MIRGISFGILGILLLTCCGGTKHTTKSWVGYNSSIEVRSTSPSLNGETRESGLNINPKSYSNWGDCFKQNRSVATFKLASGDYRSWGEIKPGSTHSKSAVRKILFESEEKSLVHPVDAEGKAIIKGFDFVTARNWTLEGLTIRGGTTNYIQQNSANIKLLRNLIEDVPNNNAIRIVSSDDTVIRDCVLRLNPDLTGSECIAITVSAYKNEVSRNTLIEKNEIYNYTDGVQLYYKTSVSTSRPIPMSGSVPGTIIRDNDIYITKDLYSVSNGSQYACAENGIDVKVGTDSDLEKDWVRISGNRLWGFRTTAKDCSDGSRGSAIVVHQNAKHIFIENNFIYDSSRGISVLGKVSGTRNNGTKEVLIFNNFISTLYGGENDSGYGMVIRNEKVYVLYNTFNTIPRLISIYGSPIIKYNIFRNIDKSASTSQGIPLWFKHNSWVNIKKLKNLKLYNNCISDGVRRTSTKSLQMKVKRITGPSNIIIQNGQLKNDVMLESNCNCDLSVLSSHWWYEEINNKLGQSNK
ncbi:hypothetical protein N8364_04410 [Saprospiraceae bacterium]|nr:hypothetical protein [Saprospiraceae bacterium]